VVRLYHNEGEIIMTENYIRYLFVKGGSSGFYADENEVLENKII